MSTPIQPHGFVFNSMEKRNKSENCIEEAYKDLKKLMLQRKLIPGQKLLYRELIETLHMSKTPIINALNRLEQEGFIVSENNRGYAVKPLDPREILDATEVREALEVKAVQLAALRGKPADLKLLEEKLLRSQEYRPPGNDTKKMTLNAEFHLQIAEMSGNKVLKYLLRRNFEHVILRIELKWVAPGRMASSAEEHRLLFESLRERDASKARDLMEAHVRNSRDAMVRSLSQEGDREEWMDFFS